VAGLIFADSVGHPLDQSAGIEREVGSKLDQENVMFLVCGVELADQFGILRAAAARAIAHIEDDQSIPLVRQISEPTGCARIFFQTVQNALVYC
jgi:hypothetical protein